MTILQQYNLLGMRWTQKQINNFLRRIVAGPNECHICTYSLSKGYPQMTSMFEGRLRTVKCHRLAYAYYFQEDPDDLMVCHRCDEPRCVNPNHLFLGTASDNTWDAIAKGRFVKVTQPWQRK